MATRKKQNVPAAAVLGYIEIAERMGIEVESVRIYKGRDPDFPQPITPPSLRSPGFSSDDVDAYIELRKSRNVGKRGRPPGKKPAAPVEAVAPASPAAPAKARASKAV